MDYYIVNVASSLVVTLLLGAGAFAFVEGRSFGNGLWWAWVTALTIGYSNLTPVTTAGRTIGVVFGHFWIFIQTQI